MRLRNVCLICFNCILLGACSTPPAKPSDKHIQASDVAPESSTNIPQPITRSIPLPAPTLAPKAETYSVVVTNVPAQEILFALARDAKINLDIQNGIQGTVTINAINQTLPQILNRIAKQVEMRYELDGQSLIVMPDSPYLKQYRIDYVNMSRDSDGGITDSTQVGGSAAGTSGGSSSGSNSSLTIKNSSKNHFWETLTQNIKDILRETDKVLPSGSSETTIQQANAISTTGTGTQQAAATKSSAKTSSIENSPIPATLQEGGTTVTRTNTFREAASVIANPESGVITVRATSKQHEKIQAFIDEVMTSARRQVLIEATILEVRLNDQNQQGINWSWLRSGNTTISQNGSAGLPATNTGSMFILNLNPNKALGSLSAQISLLESFGTVKVLSSPKISVMNNQTAVLRVVDNLVYFTIKTQTDTTTGVATTTYTTTPNTVPVGFTMSVTPQINDSDTVQLNLRPSITRLLSYINDPNPALANPCGSVVTCGTPAIVSKIPQVQTREMESILKIESNQVAVMGGLMQDEVNNLTDSVPGLSRLPLIGTLFKNRNDTNTKTELVIFLRPIVIKDASLNGDFSAFRSNLPQQDFLERPTAESASRTQ